MKKIFAFIIAVSLLAAPVSAADLDLSSMSIDELVELRKSVDAEIQAKVHEDDYMIPMGEYKAGEDILSGKFLFTATESGYIFGYENEEARDKDDPTWIHDFKAGDQEYLELKEGTIIRFTDPYIMPDLAAPWKPAK